MESEAGHRDALQGNWNSDALFGFAVQAILDHQARPSRLGEDRVWRRPLEMGLCQGHSSLDAPSELNPPQRIPSPLSIAPLVPQAEG